MAKNNDYSTLAWVKHEIDETLNHARQSLEEYVENTEDLAQLRFCTTYLHQVAGTLQMVELYGASLIAEEMEKLGMGLLNNEVPQKQDAYELLMRSILQLPDYLEKILTGYKDDPLLVMPLLNDLRASRGEPLLSENALFTPDLTGADDIVVARHKKVSSISKTARKLRHLYQVGLLGWYRKQNPQTSLHKLATVLTELEQICERREAIRLWWVANGLVEALIDQGLEVGVALNKILGHVDREIKRLIDFGEQGVGDSSDLLKNLLYYIAQSTSNGGRVNAIKTSFSLDGALPSEEERQVARESISGPNRELMQTVGNAIREDLAGVKEVLDLYLRNPNESLTDLKEQSDLLRKTADTLGMLGLGVPRRLVQDQIVAINHIVDGGTEVSETNLMAIASALLFVESSLVELTEKQRAGLAADEVEGHKFEEKKTHALPDVELRQIQEAVLKEVCKELSIAKESIVSFIDSPWDHSLLVSVPHQFNQARGAILIVGLDEPARLLQIINSYLVKEILEPRVQPEYETLDIFADAIASVEYYLESLLERRPNIDFLLNVARESLAKLGIEDALQSERAVTAEEDSLEMALTGEQSSQLKQEGVVIEQTGEFEMLDLDMSGDVSGEDLHEFDADASGIIDLSDGAEEQQQTENFDLGTLGTLGEEKTEFDQEASGIFDLNEIEQETVSPEPKETEIEQATQPDQQESKVVSLLDDIDEEIIDIFIEEAEEELAVLQELLPQWAEDSDNQEALSRMRRSFHTLKGSGRMVGALVIGELAWSIENMMNRVLEQTIPMVPEVTQLVEEAVSALPGLVECLKGAAEEPDVDLKAISKRAFDLVDVGKEKSRHVLEDIQEYEKIESVADTAAPVQREDSDELPDVMDPVLYEIFSNESEGHLAVVDDFVKVGKEQAGNHLVTEDLVRALHTLHGSARMARVDDIAELAGALEKYTKAVMGNGTSLSSEGVVVLVQGSEEIRAMLGQINEPSQVAKNQTELLGRIRTLLSVEIVREEEYLRQQQIAALASAQDQPETAEVRYDDEILDVFLEEGAEILASSEAAITGWLESPDDNQFVEHLQRDLHTLKGGARMAKLQPIADLSHATESLLTDIVDGECESSPAAMALIQRTLDRLFQMLEVTESKQPVQPARDLIELLENARSGIESEQDTETAKAAPTEETPAEQKKPAVSPIADLMNHQAQVIPLAKRVDQIEEAPRPGITQTSGEMIRLPASVLDGLVNNAGEASIYRARLEQQMGEFKFNLTELEQTVARLHGQLRNMEIETETQVLYRHEKEDLYDAEFDPLEMDQYSRMQELSRALVETTSDVSSIQSLLENLVRESETLLVQQARVNTDLQEGLMRTRMVSFKGLVPRMKRIVRQTSDELGKKAELFVIGEHGEMDRSLLERVTAPLEHMLRNALSHGIESPEERDKLGKPEQGNITLTIQREGSDVLVTVADDGQGLDLAALRIKAEERGMLESGSHITDHDLMQFILESGFSTAQDITNISGRGVGMDVVNSQVKQLGGSLEISSRAGSGTTFVMRLPFTLAVNHALLVDVGEEAYAIPLSSIEGIVRMSRDDLVDYLIKPDSVFEYAGEEYSVMSMNDLLSSGHSPQDDSQAGKLYPVLLVRTGDHRSAVQVDGLRGSREVVVKSVGPQISTVRGISGATILGDGSVVLILDMGALVRAGSVLRALHIEQASQPEILSDVQTVMVVDDSITVRKVTTRLLERNGFEVITAKDGVDAIAVLQEHIPDVMLLDIEMPRMDGFELATHMRNEGRLKKIPIIMITSRTGDKHRVRADVIGIDYYMGKPYQEAELLENIEQLVGSR